MIAEIPVFYEIDVNQSVCRESFMEFVKEFWDVLIPETPIWNWHIPYLCNELQLIAEEVFLRKPKLHDCIINIPPGTTKSTICSIMFPAWLWTRQPELRVVAASYEQELALTFAVKTRDVITSEKYQAMFRFKQNAGKKWRPSTEDDAIPITLRQDVNAKGMYQNTMMGDRKSVGTSGQVMGSHSHIIIVDDPINPKESVSKPGLAEVNRFMSHTLPSRKVDKKMTPTILIMQRLHEDDPTGHWLEKKPKKLKHICLPAKLNDGGEVKPARLVLKYKEQDGYLDPIRLDQVVLDEQLKELGKYAYAGQYAQTPIPLGGGMFEVEKVQFGYMPRMSDFIQIIRYWDKAGSQGTGAESAGVKVGKTKSGAIWIMDCLAGQWSVTRRNAMMYSTAQADGEDVIMYTEQEPGSGGKESAENSIKLIPNRRVRLDRVTGDKVTRAEPLAGQMGIGNVWVPHGVSWWPDLREQLRFFPFGRLKDKVDAASGGFAKLNNRRMRLGTL